MVVEMFMYVYTQDVSITFTYLYMYVECSGGRKITLPFREMRSFLGTKSSPREKNAKSGGGKSAIYSYTKYHERRQSVE